MKKHPEMGAELIKDIHYLEHARPVILYHHERWNGSGYPYGLKGEKIPANARIVAIADSFDAMTTKRPYRKELTPQLAFNEIESGSGIQYDPLIVETFQHAWVAGDIYEIFKAFPQ